MAMIKCPECGRDISSFAPVCPDCGVPQEIIKRLLADQNNADGGNDISEEISVQPLTKTADDAKTQQDRYQPSRLVIGQTYRMGQYQGEEISWKILAVEENKALLIIEKVLDKKRYNKKLTDVTWETCTLREWLNTDFLNSAFTAKDRERIVVTKVCTEKNPKYNNDSSNDTEDKVFLLSIQEAQKYFRDDKERKAVPTVYAIKNGAYTDSSTGGCWCWLRSPGFTNVDAANIDRDGAVYCNGSRVNSVNVCVRPAIWVNLNQN